MRAGAAVMRAACAVALGACVSPPGSVASQAGAPPDASSSDTLRGTLLVTGSEPFTQLVLRPATGAAVALDDAHVRPALRAAAGLDVLLRGARVGAQALFVVREFSVRSADGLAAADGVLVMRGSAMWLARGAEGDTVAVPALPVSLRGAAGARVWLAGPLDRAPGAYGVLVPAPR